MVRVVHVTYHHWDTCPSEQVCGECLSSTHIEKGPALSERHATHPMQKLVAGQLITWRRRRRRWAEVLPRWS